MNNMNNINIQRETVEVDKDVSNNIGDFFKQSKMESKQAIKLKNLRIKLDEAKEILVTLDMDDDLETARGKLTKLLGKVYSGHHLVKQFGYIKNKRSTTDLVTQAYYVMASKEEHYEKAVEAFEVEMDELGM